MKKPATPKLIRLRKRIREARDAYFNAEPIMSDEEYDMLIDELTEMAPKDALLTKVGAKPVGKTIVLPRNMNSLPKVRVGEKGFTDWVNKYGKGDVRVEDKLDGVSLEYGNDGDSYHLYTRGDGSTGTDVSFLIPYIKGLGDIPKSHAVRGELVITKADFRAMSDKFANARNLASGIVNSRKGIHEAAKRATFIVHGYVHPEKPMTDTLAAKLKNMGFRVATAKTFNSPTEFELADYYQSRMEKSTVDIDGVVLKSKTSQIALKAVNDVVRVTVLDVEWNISRHGLYKPVVTFAPVRIAGASVSRATAHNAKNVEKGIGPGAVLEIVRSGEVIPKIVKIVKKAKPLFPKGKYEWNGADIVSTEERGDDQTALVMSNFLTVIEVKNFKSNIMLKLIDGGIDTVKKLIKATPARLEACGLGKKQADVLSNSIRSQLQAVQPYRLMAAVGVFPSGFGLRRLKAITDAVPYDQLTLPPAKLLKKVSIIPGIGENTAKEFVNALPKYFKLVEEIKWTAPAPKRLSGKQTLKGVVFAFSGIRDAALEELITSKGGSVSGVTKKTTYLVAKPGFSSSKTEKAEELGVKIITIDQARKLASK